MDVDELTESSSPPPPLFLTDDYALGRLLREEEHCSVHAIIDRHRHTEKPDLEGRVFIVGGRDIAEKLRKRRLRIIKQLVSPSGEEKGKEVRVGIRGEGRVVICCSAAIKEERLSDGSAAPPPEEISGLNPRERIEGDSQGSTGPNIDTGSGENRSKEAEGEKRAARIPTPKTIVQAEYARISQYERREAKREEQRKKPGPGAGSVETAQEKRHFEVYFCLYATYSRSGKVRLTVPDEVKEAVESSPDLHAALKQYWHDLQCAKQYLNAPSSLGLGSRDDLERCLRLKGNELAFLLRRHHKGLKSAIDRYESRLRDLENGLGDNKSAGDCLDKEVKETRFKAQVVRHVRKVLPEIIKQADRKFKDLEERLWTLQPVQGERSED